MKLLILLVSCPYGNLHSSRYTRLTNGYRKLQYNGFFRNGFNFRPWNHDAIIWTFFDDGIWSWVPFSYLVSFPLHIVLFSGCNSSTDRQRQKQATHALGHVMYGYLDDVHDVRLSDVHIYYAHLASVRFEHSVCCGYLYI